MFSSIQVIFFDLGDTLVRIKIGILEKICETIGRIRKQPLEINSYMDAFRKEWTNRNIKDVIEDELELNYWQGFFEALLTKLGVTYGHKILAKELAKIYSDSNSFECFEDVHTVLTELRSKGYRLGLLSNAFPSAERIINDLGLRNYFQSIFLSFQLEEKYIKPEPEIYQFAARQVDVEISHTLFVDDRCIFVKAAMDVGMNAFLIERFTERDQEPVTAPLVPRVSDLYELKNEIFRETGQTKPISYLSSKKSDGDNPARRMSVDLFAIT